MRYTNRLRSLFGSSIISFLPLTEISGETAYDASGNGRNGAYTGVDLANAAGPDGKFVPFFGGADDYLNWYSASLASAFDSAEGSLMIWGKVNSVAVWTDSTARVMAYLLAGVGNIIGVYKNTTNNNLIFEYKSGGVDNSVSITLSTTAWFCAAMTWSASGDAVKAYLNGAQQDVTQTELGEWAGALSETQTMIGAYSTSAQLVWHGWLAYALLLNRAATPAEIARAARV